MLFCVLVLSGTMNTSQQAVDIVWRLRHGGSITLETFQFKHSSVSETTEEQRVGGGSAVVLSGMAENGIFEMRCGDVVHFGKAQCSTRQSESEKASHLVARRHYYVFYMAHITLQSSV